MSVKIYNKILPKYREERDREIDIVRWIFVLYESDNLYSKGVYKF